MGVLAGVLALALPACVHYVQRAGSAYDDGRYLEVAEDLAAHEREVEQLPPAERAQYGMYRGLSLLELGELAAAQRWLDYSTDVEKMAPGSLTPFQRAQLERGKGLLDKLRSQRPAEAAPESPRPELEPRPMTPERDPASGSGS